MTRRGELTGRHVLIGILAFFGVTFAVNAVFLTQALRTFPGEETEKSYLQGLEYNDVLAARAAQAELGWSARLVRASRNDDITVIELAYTGADGAPLRGLSLSGSLRRPADAKLDRDLAFRPAGDGVYRAETEAVAPGLWEVQTVAKDAFGAQFEVEARLTLEE